MDVSGDGGVVKRVLRAAPAEALQPSAENPIADVHYEGRLQETEEVFDSSRVDGAVFSFEVGKGKVIRGWDIAVRTMKVGELAEVTCSAEYAYGSKGSPPDIPPGATLVFEVELIGVRQPKASGKGDVQSAHERLAEMRQQREEAAKKRDEEKKKREDAKAAAAARVQAKLGGKKEGKGGKSKK